MKLLLLNVLATAVACSSLNLNAQDRIREAHKDETPKLAVRHALDVSNITDENNNYLFDNSINNLSETDDYSNQSSFNLVETEQPRFNLEEASDLDFPIYKRPIEGDDPWDNPLKSSLYDSQDENGKRDDKFNDAVVIGDKGIIRGYVDTHNGNIDKDYFRFSIYEERKYHFNLEVAPGPNYFYEIRSFGHNYSDSYTGTGEHLHHLLYSSKNGSRKRDIVLRAGTYFIVISSSTKNGIRPENQYRFKFDYSYAEDNIENLELTDSIYSNYGIVTWESEYGPLNMNHISNHPYKLCDYKNEDALEYDPVYFSDGYLDPIYMENGNKWKTNKDRFELEKGYRLDSITYLLKRDTLKEFKDKISEIMVPLSKESQEKEIREIKLRIDGDAASLGLGIAGIAISFIGVASTGAGFILSIVVSGIGIAMAISDAMSFSADLDHYVSVAYIFGNLTALRDACEDVLDNKEPDTIIALPKFSYLCKEVIQAPFLSLDVDTIRCKIGFTPYVPELNKRSFYFFPKYGTIQRFQKIVKDKYGYNERIQSTDVNGASSKHIKGKIRLFETVSDYYDCKEVESWNQSTFYEGSFHPRLGYGIYKSGSEYKLHAYNYEVEGGLTITYNTVTPGNDYQGQVFNFSNDGYGSTYIRYFGSADISLGTRKYIYVREGDDPFVTKISLNDDGETKFSSAYMFNNEYLKLTILSKPYWDTWKIRVRNFTNKMVKMYYNSKMCNPDDAKGWTSNLTNWTNTGTWISKDGYADITIKQNWFATAIAVCYVDEESNTRYVSYATALNENGNSLSYRMNAVGI